MKTGKIICLGNRKLYMIIGFVDYLGEKYCYLTNAKTIYDNKIFRIGNENNLYEIRNENQLDVLKTEFYNALNGRFNHLLKINIL